MNREIPIHAPLAIVGAGPVGMLAALQLAKQGLAVCLLEARAAGSVRDKRTIALSYTALQAFVRAGVALSEEAMSPIEVVHVSRQGSFGRTILRAADIGLSYLGVSVDYAALVAACEAALAASDVLTLWQTNVSKVATLRQMAQVWLEQDGQERLLTCDYLVLAEGGKLTANLPHIRRLEHDYQQCALVNTLSFSEPNTGMAYERFTDEGPFALLPYGRDFRLVWTCRPEEARAYQAMDLPAFAPHLYRVFGHRLGQLQTIGQAAAFPLYLRELNRVYTGRIIAIGNAAQTMHPVAAQGLNLGVRDALALCTLAEDGLPENWGLRYGQMRRLDARAVVGFTHGLVTLFDHAHPLVKWGQSGGMSLLNLSPSLRRSFTRHLVSGLSGNQTGKMQ